MYNEDLALKNLQGLICHKAQAKHSYMFNIYVYKEDLALKNLQGLICHKTQATNKSKQSDDAHVCHESCPQKKTESSLCWDF